MAREKRAEESSEREVLDGERRRRYLFANVRQYPDPVLRTPANEVTDFDEALGALVLRMTRVMQAASGIGLAAPQLGVLQRVLVYQADEDAEPMALVNPRIVSTSEETDTIEEGCLSIDAAGVTVEIERPARVTVEARSPRGEEVRIEAEGLEARVVQHESDHLDGVLILDRASSEQRRVALGKLRPKPVLGSLAE